MTTRRQKQRERQRQAQQRLEREARTEREFQAVREHRRQQERVKKDQPRRDVDRDMPHYVQRPLPRPDRDTRRAEMPPVIRTLR